VIYNNDLIATVFGRNRDYSGLIGLELEVEGSNLAMVSGRDWQTISDGSLRDGGLEYVTNGPKSLIALENCLEQWAFSMRNSRIYESDRTSVHTHVNMLDKSVGYVTKGLTAYYLLENALIRYCGPSRVGNLFCTTLGNSPSQLTHYKALCGSSDSFNPVKYSAMNLGALSKFGSVEMRGMRGEYDTDHLIEWCSNLSGIFEKADEFPDCTSVFDHIYNRSYKDYLGTFLSSPLVDKIVRVTDWDLDFSRNCVPIGSFLYNHEFSDRPAGPQHMPRTRHNDIRMDEDGVVIPDYLWSTVTSAVPDTRLSPGLGATPRTGGYRDMVENYRRQVERMTLNEPLVQTSRNILGEDT